MRIFTLLAVLFITMQTFSQDVKGYYITDSGQKVEGYFDATDFNDISLLKFKTLRNSNYSNFSVDGIREYGINDNEFKFEKHTVQIDISDSGKNLSTQKNPEMKTETLFLNVIVEGDATLYSYTKDYKTKFFFSTKKKPGEPEQFIYKKYQSEEGVAENVSFRQQLFNAVRCSDQMIVDFFEVRYDNKELTDIFKNYNNCTDSKYTYYYNGFRKKREVRYTVFAGIHKMNFGISEGFPPVNGREASTSYDFGFEAAYVLPSEKFELFAQIAYQSISGENVDAYDQGYNILTSTYKVEGSAVNVFFGPRVNFLINEKNKLFVDASFGMSFPVGLEVSRSARIKTTTGFEYDGDSDLFSASTSFCVNFGVGYAFNDKFGLSLRYETNRDVLDDVYSPYKTKINRLGLNLRYSLN
ncbi:hypothetical protein D3C87_352470 [compost metagenome]